MHLQMALDRYRQKRRFGRTPEPAGGIDRAEGHLRFVVQKHRARALHFDLRLELDGVLKSWAVPKGPSLDPTVKRLAMHTEDHPLEYLTFEGVIPKGEYGGGEMIVWDTGTWEQIPARGFEYPKGKLKFRLHGERLQGDWTLVRMKPRPGESGDSWLLFKERDSFARPESEFDVTAATYASVLSGRTLDDLKVGAAAGAQRRFTFDGKLPGAVKAAFPSTIELQLAKTAPTVPKGDEWIHEIKFDGYRLVCFKTPKGVRLLTRSGLDWTDRFPSLAKGVATLPADQFILDGEVVALRSDGVSSFEALQGAFRDRRESELVFYAFDLLHLGDFNLRGCALLKRKELLRTLLAEASVRVRYCDHIEGHGPEFLERCREHGLEGILSKRGDRPYRGGRTDDWLKSKCLCRQEFVIGGFTHAEGSRVLLGAILVGYYDAEGRLVYAGKVGSGFTEQMATELKRRLDGLKQPGSPFEVMPRAMVEKGMIWTAPQLVAQVAFGNWTSSGVVRHPSFQGLREDVPARSVSREEATAQSGASAVPQKSRSLKASGEPISSDHLAQLAGVRLTNPQRVVYPEDGITKFDLAAYFTAIVDWILPHIVDRPLSLVRCPDGVNGTHFFQKHPFRGITEGILRIRLPGSEKEQLYIRDLAGLMGLVQASALEIHPLGARIDNPERPDRMIFDLDPDEGVPWVRVIAGALRLRDVLAEVGLVSFVKTSGGKGLHIVVPVERRCAWDEVSSFATLVAQRVMADLPGQFVVNRGKAARAGKTLIDIRSHRGATSIAAYSPRARPGAAVSMPIEWDEVTSSLRPHQFTVRNAVQRLSSLTADPWAGLSDVRQAITAAMKKRLQAPASRERA